MMRQQHIDIWLDEDASGGGDAKSLGLPVVSDSLLAGLYALLPTGLVFALFGAALVALVLAGYYLSYSSTLVWGLGGQCCHAESTSCVFFLPMVSSF